MAKITQVQPAAVGFDAVALALAKEGNTAAECEDAHALDPRGQTAVLSDGASDGIFARAWATLLTRRYLADLPDLDDAPCRAAWLDTCRQGWTQQFNIRTLRYTQQVKVKRTGAAA